MNYSSRYFTYRHYNNKNSKYNENPVWGFCLTPVRRVGINLDIYLGQHNFALWIYPTRKYGRGTRD